MQLAPLYRGNKALGMCEAVRQEPVTQLSKLNKASASRMYANPGA
jgi:hypothetical protein